LRDTLVEALTATGKFLLENFKQAAGGFNKIPSPQIPKAMPVADLNAEAGRMMINVIRRNHPDHSVLSEESGSVEKPSDFIWTLDPLDGALNFVSQIPWFGVQAALLKKGSPVLGGIYLPATDTLYICEKGKGAVTRDGQPVSLSREQDPARSICVFSMDNACDPDTAKKQTELMSLIAVNTKSMRHTDSVVDFCMIIDGRVGAAINLSAKIWSIAAVQLMVNELGGILTDFQGKEIMLNLNPGAYLKNYMVIAAGRNVSKKLVTLAKLSGF
jgi:myo-inositol-1(or 4)-monophosphatase